MKNKNRNIRFLITFLILINLNSLKAEYIYSINPDSVILKIETKHNILQNQIIEIEKYLDVINHLHIFYKTDYFKNFLNSYERKVISLGNDLHLGNFYFNKGKYYYNLGNNDSALVYLFRSLQIFEKTKNYVGITHSSIYIGIINTSTYNNLYSNKNKTEEYFKNAYYSSNLSDDLFAKAAANWSMCDLFLDRDIDSAYYFLNNAYQYLEKLPDSLSYFKYFGFRLLPFIIKKSNDLLKKVNFNKFIKDINQSIKELDESKFIYLFSKDFALAESFFTMGYLDSAAFYAKKYIDKGSVLSYDFLSNYRQFMVYYYLYQYEKSKRNYRNALFYYEKYVEADATSQRNDPRVVTLEIEQQIARERYLNEKRLQAQKERFMLIIAGIIIIAITFIFVFFYKRYKDKKRLNEALSKLNNTKDKLFSIVVHDLRSPVASLKQMLDVVTMYYDRLSDEAKQKYINSLRESSNRLHSLLDNLLVWARLNLGKIKCQKAPNDVNSLIKYELELLSDLIEKKKLSIVIKDLEQAVQNIDENIFRIIFRNLMSNAIKFSPEGAKIEVTLENFSDKFKIVVKDQGIGMPKEVIDSLKNRTMVVSQPGTANEKGNGLGLSIVSDLVEQHGGSLDITAETNVGTAISVILDCSNNITHKE